MEKFKFRAWDLADEMMYCDAQLGIVFDDGSHYPFERFLGNQDDGDYHDWELMQCTGLKDKNGKLIFEGDICEGAYQWGGVFGVIKFELGCFHLALIDDPTIYTAYDIDFGQLEVVGNIFETPELLEQGA